MNKYRNGKIYKITDIENTKCYIGSTIMELSHRMMLHKSCYKRKYRNITVYQIFDEFGFENCKIELIEHAPCDSKKDLEHREGYYIRCICCVNCRIAGRTGIEYYYDNHSVYNEKMICNCGGKYTRTNYSKHVKTNLHKLYLQTEI